MGRDAVVRVIIMASLVFMASTPTQAYDRYGYYPYGRSYGHFNPAFQRNNELELARIRRELEQQRRLGRLQLKNQDQQIDIMRERLNDHHQVSAAQACYYRSTGGFELCEDLFAKDSTEFASCEALVVQRNPGCNQNAGESEAPARP